LEIILKKTNIKIDQKLENSAKVTQKVTHKSKIDLKIKRFSNKSDIYRKNILKTRNYNNLFNFHIFWKITLT
jgi:hypothetical protein